MNLSEAELWQKQNNLNLKYINLTKLDNWRKNNLTKFLLIEIPKDWNGECGGFANQPNQIENNTKYQINYDLNEMIKSKEKYLRILPPPQIHKLFKDFRNQIKELFSFSNKVRTIVDKYISEIFR
nr:unnamed protein product [Meloidogyne enterolobii]